MIDCLWFNAVKLPSTSINYSTHPTSKKRNLLFFAARVPTPLVLAVTVSWCVSPGRGPVGCAVVQQQLLTRFHGLLAHHGLKEGPVVIAIQTWAISGRSGAPRNMWVIYSYLRLFLVVQESGDGSELWFWKLWKDKMRSKVQVLEKDMFRIVSIPARMGNTHICSHMGLPGSARQCVFFPTCQVRVVRFYQSCSSPSSSPPLPPPSPPPPLPPLPCSLPPCQLFANFRTQWALLLDLNCNLWAHWTPLDLNLGPSELSEHRWTSNWDRPSSVSTAGPQPGTPRAQWAPLDLNWDTPSSDRWPSTARKNARRYAR